LKTNRLNLGGQAHSLDLDLHRAPLDTGFVRLNGLSTDRTILLDSLPVIPKNPFICDTDSNQFGYAVRVFVSRRYSPKTSTVPCQGVRFTLRFPQSGILWDFNARFSIFHAYPAR
jgi:hypothetical protein